VGPPLKGVECRIAEDGEVLIRGDLVMTGYWNNPEANAAALVPAAGEDRPWLHTGDVGVMEEGYLRITDRKKDFIKTLGGDMVSPAKIESLLMAEPEIHQAVIAGEGRPALAALIVPAEGMAGRTGEAVRRVNAKLPTIERIRHFAETEPFTIENGLLTPTMKVKRRAAVEARAAEIEALWD
jgi:long-chain acyl-CoA synthetase